MARFTYHCPMRWADQDPFGHVNNTVYLAYLEQARVDLFFRLAGDEGLGSFERGIVIARHEIDYLRPVEYRAEPLRIELWCGQLRGASFTVEYEVYGGTGPAAPLTARARSWCAPYDLDAGRPRRLAEPERAFLDRFTDTLGGAS
ncbi:MAG: acyl-CoA thioesterase [Actinobacteria bacterium]|nr:acyl-CoA thioesterase [Actinomycetota bacterium]MBI3688073.1 acyl-CoA thioesterase [Actinomycetota bacterium]